MYRVLTIDVGLLNLGVCVMSYSEGSAGSEGELFKIDYWNTLNILSEERVPLPVCNQIQQNTKLCGQSGKFKLEDQVYCKRHSKNVLGLEKMVQPKEVKVKLCSLQHIAQCTLTKFGEFLEANLELLSTVDKVLVELQPRVNNKMKFVSHLLFGKLTEALIIPGNKPLHSIVFERAAKKLQVYKGPEISCHLKNPYDRRKYFGIEHTRWFLSGNLCIENNEEHLNFFEATKKKDDLSDAFLMAVNATKPTKQDRKKKRQEAKKQELKECLL